ncbi:MAG: serine/threonine-protein kinase [Jatrophihabitans sp.]
MATSASGSLWRARDRHLGRDVAIKQVDRSAVESAQQLRHEAQVLAGLSHANIVQVFNLIHDAGQLWLVEEWIDGVALDAVVRDAGPMRPEQALGIVRGALQGLAYAHAAGIVHRDVSPTNMLLTRDGVSKLVDFGLAAATGVPGVSGTPGYLSPEAVRGLPLGPSADVYSSAAVLVMLLRGRPLFAGPTPEAVISQQLLGGAPDLHGVRGSIRTVLRRALAEDPRDRYSQAQAFLDALEQAAQDEYGSDWYAAAGVAALVTVAADLAAGAIGTSTLGSGSLASSAAQASPHVARVVSSSVGEPSLGVHTIGVGVRTATPRPLQGHPRAGQRWRLARRSLARALSHRVAVSVVTVGVVGAVVGVSVAVSHHSASHALSAKRSVATATSTPTSGSSSTPVASPSTTAVATVHRCPVPPAQLGGRSDVVTTPASIQLPVAVAVPANAVVFGTSVPGRLTYYILGPTGLVCSPGFGSADGGFAQSLSRPGAPGASVSYLFSPGGAGANQTLACGYIPAVAASVGVTCGSARPPSTDTITPVSTSDPDVEAATVLVSPGTADPGLGPSPAGVVTYALFVVTGQRFTCHGGCGAPSVEGSQRAQCALPATQLAFCKAALDYFVTQSLAAHTPAQAAIVAAIDRL